MKFILDNILLVALALVSGGLLLWPLLRKGGGSSTSVSTLEATQLINHRNAIVVDVRDDKDFALGSLAGARNIPFDKLADRAGELVRFKSRPVVIVCATGQQSTRAIATFKAQGFEEAHSLAGGIAAWKQASLPLVLPGREAAKAATNNQQRKPKNDRSGDRNRASKVAARDVTVVAAVPASANDAVAPVSGAAPDETPPPARLKETS